jgi:hypothetical protein
MLAPKCDSCMPDKRSVCANVWTDALPFGVLFVDYQGETPKNLWANKAHLKTGRP